MINPILDKFDKEKYKQYKELFYSRYIELHEMALMLTGHKFTSSLNIPKKYHEIVSRKQLYTYISQNTAPEKPLKFNQLLDVLSKYTKDKNNRDIENPVNYSIKGLHYLKKCFNYTYLKKDEEDFINDDLEEQDKDCFYIELNKDDDKYNFFEQPHLIFLAHPIAIIRDLCNEGFILPLELQDLIGLRQFPYQKKVSITVERHLRTQAVALVLFIISGNKMGIEDICNNSIMIEMNSDFYFRKDNENPSRDKRHSELNTVRNLISKIIKTKRGNKTNDHKNSIKALNNQYKKTPFLKSSSNKIATPDYNKIKPLPNVFEIIDKKKYIDFPRFNIVMSTWDAMVENGFISINIFCSLALNYFKDAKYELGLMYPDSIPFGTIYHKKLDNFLYEQNLQCS